MNHPTTRRSLLRSAALGAGALALGPALAACGSSRRPTGGASAPAVTQLKPPTTATTIEFWHGFTGPDGQTMQQLVSQFNSETPTVRVNATTQSDFDTKLRAAAQSGQLPHVGIHSLDELPQLAEDSIVNSVDDLAGLMGVTAADFTTESWNASTWKGKRYGIPFSIGPECFFYNKDLFAKAGVDPANPPTDMASFEAAATAITQEAGVPGFMVVTGGPGGAFLTGIAWSTLFYQGGGAWTSADYSTATFNSNAGVQAADYLTKLIRDLKVSPANVQSDAEIAAFAQGTNGMVMSGNWQLSRYTQALGDKLGIARMPAIFGHATWASAQTLCVYTRKMSTDERQASFYFHDWLSRKSADWAKSGAVPARSSVRQSAAFNAIPYVPQIAKSIGDSRFFPTFPGSGDLLFATGGAGEAVLTAINGKATAKSALDHAAAHATRVLQAAKQKYGF